MATNNDTKTTRRTVLAVLGTALVPACRRGWSPPQNDPTSRSQIKPYVPGAETFDTYEEHWVNSSCAQCPSQCGIRVRVVEGRAVRIEGNAGNPLSSGGIGVRGLSGLQALYDPDRITHPLKRVAGRLVPISWGDALAELSAALAKTRARAPERLLVMSGLERGFRHELLARLCHAFGSPNFVDGSPSHSATLARAMETSLGVRALPAYDWGGAGAVLSLETGLFEDACQSVHFARAAAVMRRDRIRTSRFIHAGPAFDLAAYNADRWHRIHPGTAGAFALGVCNVLLRDGTYDPAAEQAHGFAEFRALAQTYTPRRVDELTGCDHMAIEDLARDLWNRRPVLVVVDERSLAFSNGLETANTALALSALLGSIENPSGGLRIAPPAPLGTWGDVTLDDTAQRGLTSVRLDGAGQAPYASARAVLDTLPAGIESTPPEIALLFAANPIYSRARPQRWRDALARVPLVVSFSPFLDETTTELAHLVLPDHTYLERFEDATPAPGAPRAVAGARVPVVTPLYDTRSTGDVVIELAHRLGGAVASAFPWRTAQDAYEQRWLGLHASGSGTIQEASPRAFLDRFYETGFWADSKDAPPRPVQLSLPATWSEPRWEGDPAQFPLALVAYHPLGHADGSGGNEPWLHNLYGRPGIGPWMLVASMSPHDAPAGLSNGDRIRVVSPYGALVMPVHLDPRLAPGCIAIPTGGGHRAGGRWARGFGVNVMELLSPVPAEDTGASHICTTRVRVEVVA